MTKVEKFAEQFADAVRAAFSKLYGEPRNKDVAASVRPTWSDKGLAQGWHDPDPRVVLIGTEHGWIQDPWSESGEDHKLWESAVNSLTQDGWGDVHWDSINPGVHTVFIDLPDEWSKTMTRRALEKGR